MHHQLLQLHGCQPELFVMTSTSSSNTRLTKLGVHLSTLQQPAAAADAGAAGAAGAPVTRAAAASNMKPRLVVTGLNGLIGTAVLRALSPDYQLVAINRRPMDPAIPGASEVECVQADVSDLDAIKDAFVGAVGTIHLAALAVDGPTEAAMGAAAIDNYIGPNIKGTYNVFEAAARCSMPRMQPLV